MKVLRIAAALAVVFAGFACDEDPKNPPPPAATGEPSPPSGSVASRIELRDDMRMLWTQHVFWTRIYLIEAIADLPSKNFTLDRLLKNQVDLGDAVKPFYGDAAGNQLTALLTTHIQQAGALVDAAKQNDMAVVQQISTDWYKNADDISNFLADANPNLPRDELKAMMRKHLDTTLVEAVARLKKDWDADVLAYDAVYDHVMMMADALTDGFIAQFPDRLTVPQESQNEQGLHIALRKLWEDHTSWTRVFIIADVEKQPDVLAATNRLLKNQVDLGDAVKPYYGIAAGTALSALLTTHITGAVEVLHAAEKGDAAALQEANNKWYANANDISVFLAKANPYLDEQGLKDMMKEHLDQTLDEASKRIGKDSSGDISAYDLVEQHILHMSDALSNAIDQQFPAGPNLGQ